MSDTSDRQFLFNNCRGRDYVYHFKTGAFFDLDRDGKQASMAKSIRRGDVCIVATQNKQRRIVTFTRYKLSHVEIMIDKKDRPCRVFFGKQLGSPLQMPKNKAAKTRIYRDFFNKNGHFLQTAVPRNR